MKTIYVGMALSGAPEEFRETFQHELKAQLRCLSDVTVLDFFWTTQGREVGHDADVYRYDKEQAESADLCVFVLDYPSTGLGMELMIRQATGKPSLFFVHTEPRQRVSRMVLGYLAETKQSTHTYTHVNDIVDAVKQHIESIF